MLDERFSMQLIDSLCHIGGKKWLPNLELEDVPEQIKLAFQCLREVTGLQGTAAAARNMFDMACRSFDAGMDDECSWDAQGFLE